MVSFQQASYRQLGSQADRAKSTPPAVERRPKKSRALLGAVAVAMLDERFGGSNATGLGEGNPMGLALI